MAELQPVFLFHTFICYSIIIIIIFQMPSLVCWNALLSLFPDLSPPVNDPCSSVCVVGDDHTTPYGLLQASSACWGRSLCPKYHWPPVERGRDAEAKGGGKKEERRGREGDGKGKVVRRTFRSRCDFKSSPSPGY